jgi:tetratricopeptide (TPR) repeat protein
MLMRRKHIIGFGLLLAAATSVPAFAQPAAATQYPACTKTVSTSESELAHQKYIAGKQDYDEGNYESALRRFRDAYTLDCTKHELLIIISAAYERKGDKKEAVNALETYVARSPTAPDVVTYQAKIDNLKKQLAATPPPTATPAATPAAPPPEAPPERQEHSVYPWIIVGAGVVALGVGIAVIATAPDLPVDCSKETKKCNPIAGESPAALKARQDDAGKSVDQPKWGTVVTIGGGALVAGGLLWHFLEPTGPKESGKTKLRPSVSPGYAGLALGGTF